MSAEHLVEIERKYAVGEDLPVPDLGAVPGAGSAERMEPAELEARYFDTPEGTLARARIALRRRTGGHDAGWHVKLPAPLGRREIQAPIDAVRPDEVPGPVLDAVRSRVRDAPLTPLAVLRTTRTAVLLRDAGGAERVEFADDVVRATDVRHGTSRSWREWEAEEVGGDPEASAALLDALEPVLLAAGARPSPSASKLGQALGALEAPPAAPVVPRTAGKALAVVLADLVERLHRDELAVQEGGVEAMHDLRRTARRIRSVLAMGEITGKPAGVRQGLGSIGALLDEVLDPAAAAGVATALLPGVPTAPGLAEARARLVDGALEEAEAGRVRVVAALGSPAHFAMLDALEALDAGRMSGPRAGDRVGSALPEAVRRIAHRAVRRAGRARDGDGDLPAVHDAASRLRYVVEVLDEAGLPGGRPRLARRARDVQRALGEHRAATLLARSLPATAERATAAGENAFVHGVLAERAEARAVDALHRFQRARDRLERAAR